MTKDKRFADGTGTHAYDVEAYVAGDSKERITFDVHASNRDQAERRVSRDGHRVISVNMTA